MDEKKALRLAVEALKEKAQRLAVDANLHDLYRLDAAHAVNASRKRKEVLEAVETLNSLVWVRRHESFLAKTEMKDIRKP